MHELMFQAGVDLKGMSVGDRDSRAGKYMYLQAARLIVPNDTYKIYNKGETKEKYLVTFYY